jgi:hypothetical protein
MKRIHQIPQLLLAAFLIGVILPAASSRAAETIEVGLAVRDITPEPPIWLAGYAARVRPADKVDSALKVQACAIRNPGQAPFVFVSLDNCEVSRAFNKPIVAEVEKQFGLAPERMMIVSSHTHAAPVLVDTLESMYQMPEPDRARVRDYSARLRASIVEAVGAALSSFKPAELEHAIGRATFAMNRRTYKAEGMSFGENPDGPVDWDVPVLKVKGTNDTVQAVLFGYACHGTSIHGQDFYTISGDYMAYARTHIETHYPGAVALYLTGMGADSNPSPRGSLLDAKRHGLSLAGAVIGVLNRPMRPVTGKVQLAHQVLELPLEPVPQKADLERDLKNTDVYIQRRARTYLSWIDAGKPTPSAVSLPIAALRIGDDLTFIAMGGEVVVDYAIRFKRLFQSDHPWLIGYAYEVPCYIPSIRILKEGGYEAQSSLIYYGFYGPFLTRIEGMLTDRMAELVQSLRTSRR